jgi:cysteine-rich repeat protein
MPIVVSLAVLGVGAWGASGCNGEPGAWTRVSCVDTCRDRGLCFLSSIDGDCTCHPCNCGDGQPGPGEECDDGNRNDSDSCTNGCFAAVCGDGVVWAGVEECDARVNSDTLPNTCRTDCRNPHCGDGVLDTGEACDDGNTLDGDGCSSVCTRCGDGAVDPREECDDGNTTAGDGCSPACAFEHACGDGLIDHDEECDDGNTVAGDGCSPICSFEHACGDGYVDHGEDCDDGNTEDGDGCSPRCFRESSWVCSGSPSVCTLCGNGVLDPGEECDGASLGGATCGSLGFDADPESLRCDESCRFDTSGCDASCPNDPVDGPVGAPCLESYDCEVGLRCLEQAIEVFAGERYFTWREGYCLRWGGGSEGCDPSALDSCPAGSVCADVGWNDSMGTSYTACLDACSVASEDGVPWDYNCDCRAGYSCGFGTPWPWNSSYTSPLSVPPSLRTRATETCQPGCSNDRECCEIWHDSNGNRTRDDGEVTRLPRSECTDTCNTATFACDRNGCPGGDCRVGDPCAHDSDCPPQGLCLDEGGTGIPGTCTLLRCDEAGRECPVGTACARLLPGLDPVVGCIVPCEPGSVPGDPGYTCRDEGAPGVADPGDGACLPVDPSFWSDGATSGGTCGPGNFAARGRGVGETCSVNADCLSPSGLAFCTRPVGAMFGFCTAACSPTLAEEGICGEPDASGRAAGVCAMGGVSAALLAAVPVIPSRLNGGLLASVPGFCFGACDHPNAPLGGATGCWHGDMACVPSERLELHVGAGATLRAGVCLTACTDDLWCASYWPGGGTCNLATGICEAAE